MKYLLHLFLFSLVAGVSPTFAADEAVTPVEKPNLAAEMAELGQIDPRQNQQIQLASKVLAYKVLDQARRTIGTVEDLVINQDGEFQTLSVGVKAVGFRQSRDFSFMTTDIRLEDNVFSSNIDTKMLKDLPDNHVATIAPAAGPDEIMMSIKNLLDEPVRSAGGEVVGYIRDVIIPTAGREVQGLLIQLKSGGKEVPIPFSMAEFQNMGGKVKITVPHDLAKLTMQYAR